MFKKLSLFLFLLLCPTFSQASPSTWDLDNVTFGDGAVATGSFVFNADTHTALDWSITVSGGDETTFPAFTYTPTTAPDVGVFDAVTGYSFQFFVDSSAQGGTPESRSLILTSVSPLTNSGGIIPLYIQSDDASWQSRECYNCSPYRLVASGSLSALPIPAAVWLFGSGIIGLIGVARQKRV